MEGSLFYLFSTVLIASCAGVVFGRHPVHAVLFLILAFINAAGLFILLKAELLAFSLVIVYVGAVAVLFLFVVMIIDINFKELRQGLARYAPIAVLMSVIFALEMGFVAWSIKTGNNIAPGAASIKLIPGTNAQQLGQLLYTHHFLAFQLAGLILLVAMIGAILLTHRHRSGVKRQSYSAQVDRSPENSLTMVKMKPGQGVQIP